MNRFRSLFLLSIPVLALGSVFLLYGLLSLLLFHDQIHLPFFTLAAAMLAIGVAALFGLTRRLENVSYRESLLFVTLTWIILGVLGGLPFMWINGLSFTDATFESVSGITATGATVITGLDGLPKTLLLYRQFLHWMGGLGVIIFVVAIMPMLNIGGMRLYKAETPGPVKGEKLAPRISHTARYLWYVYLVITLACVVAFWLAGMSLFDAVAHAFATVSTGGFSTHDASFSYFNSATIEAVAMVFMLLGAMNFGLHFVVFNNRRLSMYWRDEETRWLLGIILSAIVVATLCIWAEGDYDLLTSLRHSAFQVISFITSTGFFSTDYTVWPGAVILLLVILQYVGGCAGSTSGGNKVVRNAITMKAIFLEVKYLIHPRGVFSLKFNRRPVDRDVMDSVKAYMFCAAALTVLLTLLLMATGLDFLTALSGVSASLNVGGVAFGAVGSNFIPLNDVATWILTATMILGRLEFFTVLVLLHPAFWRR
ncbi:MAG TPA: TrkH family potassium uptake protein [Dongiaceae bacterium]|nr:TrkH family potassium uptake protein [Dongiaceae bacterium]